MATISIVAVHGLDNNSQRRIIGPGMELQRLLRSQGFGSRAECRVRVLAGRVKVAGDVCVDPYAHFEPAGLSFTVDGEPWNYREFVYLAMSKPAGYECSRRPQYYPSVYSLLPQPLATRGVQTVGRLDQDSTGLLLLSDDGQFIHTFTSPRKRIPKVYEVTTRHKVEDAQVMALLSGVELHDDAQPVEAVACIRLDEKRLRLTVTEGKYHLVKRMIAAAGNRVEALHRIAVGGFSLPLSLPVGHWMWLESPELELLAQRG